MNTPPHRRTLTRREAMKDAGRFSAASALAVGAMPGFHVGQDSTIQIALVGCGGRGSGAARNALSVKRGPMRLVAMADVFEDRLKTSFAALDEMFAESVDVPEERKFVGFDGYKHAMDCLRPGDVVILATPPAFRWVHFTYAIEKGLNVFMEKPVTVDGPASRRMLDLAERAREKNLKVGVGLMSRHSRALQELANRIRDGELGEIIGQYGYRMQGTVAFFRSLPKPDNISDLMYQIQRFHSFLWASGGAFNDFFIHIVDHLCWMKGSWPVKAHASGGRHYRQGRGGQPYVDQNLDSYTVEYTYADGTKMMFQGRNIDGADVKFSSYLHGTKGSAVVSARSDCGLPSSIHPGYDLSRSTATWVSDVPEGERNPYQNEWEALINAIRDDQPFNEVKRGVEASLVCNMGRKAAHIGHEVTFEDMLACDHEFAPGVAELTPDAPAPLQPDADGRYPVPLPGVKRREY